MIADVRIGHLGWSRHRPGVEVYDGNDPSAPDPRPLLFSGDLEREGATVIVVILPGRFSKYADEVAEEIRAL